MLEICMNYCNGDRFIDQESGFKYIVGVMLGAGKNEFFLINLQNGWRHEIGLAEKLEKYWDNKKGEPINA